MSLDTTNLTKFLKGITDAIRAKTGSTDPIKHWAIDDVIKKFSVKSLINSNASDDDRKFLCKIIGGGNIEYKDKERVWVYKPSRQKWPYVFGEQSTMKDTCIWTDENLAWLDIDTSSGTDFSNMFDHNVNITRVPQFDYSNGTNFRRMFNFCIKLKTANLSGKLINGVDFSYMFSGCYALENVDLGNMKKGVKFEGMFERAGAKDISITIPDLPMAEDINTMFYSSGFKTITFGNTPKLKKNV